MDAAELEKNYPRFSDELANTLMNLHNNEAGRLVSIVIYIYIYILLLINKKKVYNVEFRVNNNL